VPLRPWVSAGGAQDSRNSFSSMWRVSRCDGKQFAGDGHERARVALGMLSEVPGAWSVKLDRWIEKTAPLLKIVDGAPAPSREDVAKLLQTIVGTWPPELSTDDPDRCAAFAGRLAGWQEKASREAKLATDWTAPNQSCEAAARQFLMGLFAADEWRAQCRILPWHCASWCRQWPCPDTVEADRSGRSGHLPGNRVLGFESR
jgi:maltooligosyltrehalose synthase